MSEATVNAQAISFGDGVSSANNLQVLYLSCGAIRTSAGHCLV